MTVRARAKHNVVLTRPHATEKGKNQKVKVPAGTDFDFTDAEFKSLTAVHPGLLIRKGNEDLEPALPAGAPVISETGDPDAPPARGRRRAAAEPESADTGDQGEGDQGGEEDEDDL